MNIKMRYFRLLFLWVALVISGSPLWAQDKLPSVSQDEDAVILDSSTPLLQENYPNFMVELFGMDFLMGDCDKEGAKDSVSNIVKKWDMRYGLTRWWPLSNCTFFYAFRINQSRFAFCPGVGWSTLYYAFAEQADKPDDKKFYYHFNRQGEIKKADDNFSDESDSQTITRSTLKMSYINLLIRFRYNTVLEEPKDGFHFWVGGKFGFRVGSGSTTIGYEQHNESKSITYTDSYNLNTIAIGLQGGAGYSRFGLMGNLTLTPLFNKNNKKGYDSIKPWSLAIYMDLL